MFENNINNPFMMNNMYTNGMIGNAMMRGTPMMGNMLRSAPIMGNAMMAPARGGGLLSSLLGGSRGASLGGIPKTFNFGTLLTNTSKALGVVKDAIPIVKEVGPMVGNMKQMLKIASIFKDETDLSTTRGTSESQNTLAKEATITGQKENDTNLISTTTTNYNEPNFFL